MERYTRRMGKTITAAIMDSTLKNFILASDGCKLDSSPNNPHIPKNNPQNIPNPNVTNPQLHMM